jgi:hypothetical protein
MFHITHSNYLDAYKVSRRTNDWLIDWLDSIWDQIHKLLNSWRES